MVCVFVVCLFLFFFSFLCFVWFGCPQVPEMLRTPLEELCLSIKLLEYNGCLALMDRASRGALLSESKGDDGDEGSDGDGDSVVSTIESAISTFLAKALEPPGERDVHTAINLLHNIGALNTDDDAEQLTPLGLRLAELPMDPRLGKMLLMGVFFKVLDPVLTICCMLSYRDPFVMPTNPQMQPVVRGCCAVLCCAVLCCAVWMCCVDVLCRAVLLFRARFVMLI